MPRTMSRQELLSLPTTVDLTTAGRALGIGRSMAYDLVQQGRFPAPVIKLGNKYRVPSAGLLDALGIHPTEGAA